MYLGYISNDERPEFSKMLNDIEDGKIDIILAKDLSRIGRKGSRTLTFIDDLKEKNVNLILTKDTFGEFNLLEGDDDLLGLSTWFNERYVKEVSKKVKVGMHKQLEKGILLQGTKFGYLKTEKKGELVVDESVRDTITSIFNWYEQGLGMRKICQKLNLEYDFLTPSQVIERQLSQKGKSYQKQVKKIWDIYMVKRILKDEIYIGTAITHKTERKDIHKQGQKIERENQYIFKNHHEAIISKEQFESVQEIMRKRAKNSSMYTKKKRDYIFGGFLRCGECGGSITGVTRIRSNKEGTMPKKMYECVSYRKYGKTRCVCHNIGEDILLANFKNFLILLRDKYMTEINHLKLKDYSFGKKEDFEEMTLSLRNLELEYKVLVSQKIKQIAFETEDKKIFIENTYKSLEEEKYKQIEIMKRRLDKLKSEDTYQRQERYKKVIDYFNQIIENDELDKTILNMLIDKIYIYHDKSARFELKINLEKFI
ncbi:MAG: recombinase family protein [Clostridia bacterium]|nr:recombinase family protein [Clostridia bacterium]